jgi:hypothetical protein
MDDKLEGRYIREQRLAIVSEAFGRQIKSFQQLTVPELVEVQMAAHYFKIGSEVDA